MYLRALQAQDFYKDKTIRFIVGYSPGGSFDLYTRVIARHFSKHVPGNPTTIVENMTGAGGIIAANNLYNIAKPDGLTIGAWAAPLVLQQIMGNEAAKFDGRKFGYLGVPSPYDTVCTFNDKSGIANMNDWFAAKRPMKISSIGPGTSTSDIPKLLKAALNLPLEVLDGYKGGADAGWRLNPRKSTATAALGRRWKRFGEAPMKAEKSARFFRPRSNPIPSTRRCRWRSATLKPIWRASLSLSPTALTARSFPIRFHRVYRKTGSKFCRRGL